MRAVRPAVVGALLLSVACDKPPPPPVSDAGSYVAVKKSAPPVTADSTVLCFGAICAKGELCFDASHAADASAPYECFAVPAACRAKSTCDCVLENHEFACPPPNRLLCSESAAGVPQVVCVKIYE